MSAEILNGDGRFILLNKPAAFPFHDVVTKTGEGPVFDLKVDLEYFSGVVYVKAEHVIEMAKTLGMSTKEETADLRAEISSLESENQRIPDSVECMVDGINDVVDNWRRGILSVADARAISGLPVDDSVSFKEDGIGPETESDDLEFDLGESESKPAESGESDKQDDKPSQRKGSAKFSAGPDDGFGF